MIVRRCFAPTAVFIVLTLLGEFDGSAAERWSRQVSNSEWIPLANPGTASGQLPRGNAESVVRASSTHLPNPIQTLALPPALQQQYQDQLIQLQKTQESIQKLLLLQQQLKAQQQLLQTQTLLPGDYSSAEDEKQVLPPSSLGNLQTAPELASEALVPAHPSTGALPPMHPPQNFLSQRPGQAYQNQELASLPVQEQILLQHGGNVEDTQEIPHTYITKPGSQRPDGKRLKGQPRLPQSSLNGNVGDEEEEVQLVYVPAETLAQRGQLKRVRGRKQYPVRQQQHRENQGNIDQTSLSPEQETLARQVLQQIQKEHEENAQFLKEERMREFTRLNEEQKALERKARLQQEALQREQELLRQKEAEKKRKELERLEEMARQQELERIREAREKQRQEELERRRLSELRLKEERRREEEARQRDERQKLELEQQRILEGQQNDQSRATSPNFQNAQSQALIREQARRQHLPDGNRNKKIRGRQRPRVNQYQEQSTYHEVTTTPSPNQPPLSVYMGSSSSRLDNVRVTDVLKILKNAKTIAVLDNVGPHSPQVFVGPSNLDPPYGYAKFDLPYLSSIDHNRVERKVDKLPFFVAPLSFEPPPGYSKIPFPAPHIGSVVVNNLSETSSESNIPTDEQNPSPSPLIEPNSYSEVDQSGSIATTASYDSSSTQSFSPESNSPKYEPAYLTPSSNSKFRFRQYYDNKPSPVLSTSYYEQSTAKTKPKHYYEQEKLTTQPPKLETTVSYRQEVTYSSTPNFQDRSVSPHEPSTKEQDLVAQLAFINQELAQQREPQKYIAEQYHSQSNLGESYGVNDVRAPVGPTQYNLPAELPPISPHLPGLVNSLLDKQEENPPVAPTPPSTTTTTTTTTPATTTTRISSTTYRPRGRGRTIPTRPRTTQAPTNRTERTRRPSYNRSKSRFTTTTEEYRESTYEPTKAKTPETTQKYNAVEHRRPASRTQKHRNRDRASSQVQNHNVQAANYENYPQSESQSNTSPDVYSPPSGPASGLYQKETPPSGMSNYPENYPTTTQTENYPPFREIQHSTPLVSDDYSRRENYPQTRPQETRYQQDATYVQNDGFQPSGLEKTPVNGFNYQIVNENSPDQTIPQRPKEYPHYQEDYDLATTVDSRVTPGEEHRYSPIYETQTQPDYNTEGQNAFRNIDNSKIEGTVVETDSNASPIFVPLQQSKQENYELPSTESLITEMTTTSTTTPAPVIIRQRVRARLGGRTHQDSAIQTRPRGSQDEYVRFSAVNNDSGRSSAATGQRLRDGSRTRIRTRPQSHGSQVQTEGNEYIKIHAAQQRLVATTERPTTTSTTARTVEEEDIDYGFIRPPNFRPLHPVHPVDTRFQAPVTYRPALSEIQHILPNDETEEESSPTHVSKNRPKYQTSNRRPTTKIFTTTTSTTTETVPVATTMPDDAVYTVKPKTRSDESKLTRVRGRVRRPGKKRITTTTESGLEANNELPLDENYPRITPQQLPVTASGQQPLYDDNFDVTPQFVPNQNRPTQFYEENSESYPPQEFVLNFGNLPGQVSQREEYDQTQLASVLPKKYSHSSRVNSDASAHSTGDIYGAESQWSTKLSKTSFQPSFASNRAPGETKRGRDRSGDNQENENTPEIITAGPEVPSVTMVVSSDYQKHSNDADNVDTTMDGFGWKTNAQDHTEKLNATTAVTNSPTTVPQNQVQSDKETLPESRTSSNNENFKEQMGDGARVTKPGSPTGRKTRRRKVRVRVRPLIDDFVTAESQHYNSAVNSLVQDQYKYNPIRESRFTTAQPIATTVTASTAAAAESTKKSLLQNFLEEMLKNDEISIPTRITSVTTELSDRTTPITTPSVFSNDGEVTTMKESYAPNDTTMNISEERIPTVNEDSNGSKATSSEGTTLSQEETEVQEESKSEEDWNKKSSQEDKSEQSDLEDVEVFNSPSNYPDESETSKKDENNITKLSVIGKEKEHVMTLKKQENIEENEAHPKNHKTKWSEVKYPLTFEKSQNALNSYSTTLIPGVVTRDEGDGSVKTLSDYVKAIFDSMKNAEGEEIAKVVEAKSETDNYNLNNTASAHATRSKESEEIDRKAGTTDSPQDSAATQRVRVEENGTESDDTQEVTKESTTTFGATTLIPDAIASTIVPSENTLITEPSTTTATSIRQASNIFRTNSTMLGKVLRTSTTTKVSHMTEICYRGRCVMTKPKMEDIMTR